MTQNGGDVHHYLPQNMIITVDRDSDKFEVPSNPLQVAH